LRSSGQGRQSRICDQRLVYVTGVGGETQINKAAHAISQVSNVATDTLVLRNTDGPSDGTFTSGRQSYCTFADCKYLRFTKANNAVRVDRMSTWVSERIGAQAYTSLAPSTAWVGRVYASSGSP